MSEEMKIKDYLRNLKSKPEVRDDIVMPAYYMVLEKVFEQMKIKELIEQVFGSDSDLFLDLVAFRLTCENESWTRYARYGKHHPTFTKNMCIYPEGYEDDFLESITQEQIEKYLDLWNKDVSKRSRVFIHPDAVNKRYDFGILELTDKYEVSDEIGSSLCYDKNNKRLLFYLDCNLNELVATLKSNGYKKICVFFDRKTYSVKQLLDLEENGAETFVVLEGDNKFVRNIVKKYRGSFERKCVRADLTYIYGTTVQEKVFSDKDRERYVHIYYDYKREEELNNSIADSVRRKKETLNDYIGTNKRFDDDEYQRLFDFVYDENGKLVSFEERPGAVEEEKLYTGYICYITSAKMDYKKAYRIYHNRDNDESIFNNDRIDFESMLYGFFDEEDTPAEKLINFVALTVNDYMYQYVKGVFKLSLVNQELNDIYLEKNSRGNYHLAFDLTKRQIAFLDIYGISEKQFKKRLRQICKQLKQPSE